jgi:rhodanese-related sulfurtransferase
MKPLALLLPALFAFSSAHALTLCVNDITTLQATSAPIVREIKPQDFYRIAGAVAQKQMTAKQLSVRLAKKSVVLIDLREKKFFDQAHIRGAINVPIEALTSEYLKTIVPNHHSRIVLYCSNNTQLMRSIALSTLAYPAIEQLGYRNVFRLEDLWDSESCRAAEKRAASTGQFADAGCESLLPLERAEK